MLHGHANGHVRFGAFEADLSTGELLREGKRFPIQNLPFRVLEVLLRAGGEMVERERLLREVWPDAHVGTQSLNTAISKLRRALNNIGANSQVIETLGSLGYRLSVPAEFPISAQDGSESLVPITLAVMPFQSLSSPENDSFSAGLTEHMIVELGRMHSSISVVVPVTATYSKEGQAIHLTTGSDPEVEYVLNGYVLPDTYSLIITARLVRTRDRICLWSEIYSCRKGAILQTHEQITRQIARAILQALPIPQLAQPRPATLRHS